MPCCDWFAGLTDRNWSAYRSSTPGGSSESINGEDGPGESISRGVFTANQDEHSAVVPTLEFPAPGQSLKVLSSSPSLQSSTLGLTNSSCSKSGPGTSSARKPRGQHCHQYIRHDAEINQIKSLQCILQHILQRASNISGLLLDEKSRNTSDSVFGHNGTMGGRPGSADYSHNTSSSNSPADRGTHTCQPFPPQ